MQIYLIVQGATVAAHHLEMDHGQHVELVREASEVMLAVHVKFVRMSQNYMTGSTLASWDYCP